MKISLMVTATFAYLSYADALETIQKRGWVNCGIDIDQHNNQVNEYGETVGFQANNCRALAVALFNDQYAVSLVNLHEKDPIAELKKNNVDIAYPSQHVPLNEILSHETYRAKMNYFAQNESNPQGTGPISLSENKDLGDLAAWVINVQLHAEYNTLSSQNINSNIESSQKAQSAFKDLLHLASLNKINVSYQTIQNILSKVGNYGEMYKRHMGKNLDSPLPRNLNRMDQKISLLTTPIMA